MKINKTNLIRVIQFFCFLILFSNFSFTTEAIERRKEQFLDQFGYMIVPAPYSIPGIGEGWIVFGSVNNVILSHADFYGYKIMGDASGYGFGVDEFHIIPKTLFIDYHQEHIDRASVMIYDQRGMDTEKDDFNNYEVDFAEFSDVNATLSFFDRRFELWGTVSNSSYRVIKVFDDKGELVTEVSEPEKEKEKSTVTGMLIDLTDDFQDPRKGLRLKVIKSESPRDSDDDPAYYVMDYSAAMYIPIGSISTFALYALRSDAKVIETGELDKEVIRESLGYQCDTIFDASERAACKRTEDAVVEQQYAQNRYGSSVGLGGDELLRAYPGDRFVGAHTLYYSAELRWNLTEEATPFDLYIISDVRTGIQLALFYELGGVAELAEDALKDMRDSYGAGARIVTGSGLVYRIDYAIGDEGGQVTMIVDYPW